MLLLPHFCYHYLMDTFHNLTKLDLTVMVTSIDGMTWYLELIPKFCGDI